MKIAPLPPDEDLRLEVLHSTGLLDSEPEQRFDDFTRLAAHLCQAPIALISLLDRDRQWFKSRQGLDATETPRDQAFCAHAILEQQPLVIEDAHQDPRFADNPLVTGPPFVRFYAGVPLHTPEGHALGTLCVIDHVPRKIDPLSLDLLEALARQVTQQVELRRLTTALGHANAELGRLQESQEDFIAAICHDLRSPLSTVAGLTDLLESDPGIDAKQRMEFLQHIGESTQKALRLASNLIDAGRFTAGGVELDRRPTAAAAFFQNLGERLSVTATLEEVEFEVDLGTALPKLQLDANAIERVVTNLVANAIRHSPHRGLVRLEVRNVGDDLWVGVRDHGAGVPESEREQLFTRYARLSGMGKGGAGLGLYIVRKLVEAHGGDVGYESPEGGGALFYFTIPTR